MTDAQTLLDSRRELWIALAPLWLDREPGSRDFEHMATAIVRSQLDRDELEHVYRLELSPVLVRHQASLAGSWRQFDEVPLLHAIMRHCLRLTPRRRRLWWVMSGLTTAMTRHRWHTLMAFMNHHPERLPSD